MLKSTFPPEISTEPSDLTETVQPTNATDKTVTWLSNDEAIATVDENGTVIAVSEGICTITVTTNNLRLTAECQVTVVIPAVATQYYCDPANGSMSNDGSQASPWSSLEDVCNAGKTFDTGDIINLLSGFHGSISISGNNSGHVIIQAAPGHQPELENISFSSASYWTLTGVKISPELASIYARTTLLNLGNSTNIIIDNCEAYSVDDISSWTANDWVALSCYGVYMEGDNNTIRNCTIRNIDFGIANEGTSDNNLIENNHIENFSGDGMRILGDYNIVQNNIIQDNYNVDDNHDDGIQSYSIDENWVVGGSTVYGNEILGNTFIQTTDPNRPFQGSLQGIGLFDGMFEDWIIENNVIICDVFHGIAIYGSINCKVINNTVIDQIQGSPEPWIKITAHKDGTPSTGNVVRNNLVSDLANDANMGVEENNIQIAYTDFSSYFVDYANSDLSLIASAPAIDAGSATDAPATDIYGTARPQGNGYDVGAFEFTGTQIIIDVTGVSVAPNNLSLIVGQSSDLTETIEPSNATFSDVTWSSDNSAVVNVDANGMVTADSIGVATITVTTEDGNFTAICNVTVSESTGNIALLKTAYSSSDENSSYLPQNAVDGSGSSRWASTKSDPQWIYVDLGQTYSINQVVLNWEAAYGEAYEIQVSDNAANWTSIYSTTTGDGGIDDISGLSGSGRYIRMYGTARGTYYGYSLYEFEVYGTSSSTAIPVTDVSLTENSLNFRDPDLRGNQDDPPHLYWYS